MKKLIVSIAFNLLMVVAFGQYDVQVASYLGTSEDADQIINCKINTAAEILLFGNIGKASFGGVTATKLDGALDTSQASIIRMSIDGQTVLSATKLPGTLTDASIDGNNYIYIAIGTGFYKLSPNGQTIIYQKDDFDAVYLDAGPTGYLAVLGGVQSDFDGKHEVRLYNASGDMVLQRKSDLRYEDLTLYEEEGIIIASGFNIEFETGKEYHNTFYEGIDFKGVQRYLGYGWSAKDEIGINPYEHTRARLTAIGKDKKFYIQHSWTGRANNCLYLDPFDWSKSVNIVGGDKYHSQLQFGEEGDTKKKAHFLRFNPITGAVELSQPFAAFSSAGPNTTTIQERGSMDIDYSGKLYLCGSASSILPYTDTYISDSYIGGPLLLVMSSDFSTRLALLKFGPQGSSHIGIATKNINGNQVIVSGGTFKTGSYLKNEIQSFTGGKKDAYYVVINAPGTSTIPSTPSTPVIDSVTAKFIKLSWTDGIANEDGFIVEKSVDGGAYFQLGTTFKNQNKITDWDVVAGKNYSYSLKAYNYTGISSASSVVSQLVPVVSAISAPSGLTVTSLTSQQISLTWNNVSNASSYIIERREKGASTFEIVKETNQLNYIDIAKYKGVQYEYRVKAINKDVASAYSDIVSHTPILPALKPALNISGLVNGLCFQLYERSTDLGIWPDFTTLPLLNSKTADSINVVEDDSTLLDNYALWYKGYIMIPEDGAYTFSVEAHKAAGLFIDEEVIVDNMSWSYGPWTEKGIAYLKAGLHQFDVQFIYTYNIDKNGNGEYDPLLTILVSGAGNYQSPIPPTWFKRDATCDFNCTKPVAPEITSIEVLSGTSVKINWQDNSENEAGFVLGRNVYTWNTYDAFKELITLPANTTSYVNNHLITDSMFLYRVRAMNYCGYSPYSNVDTVYPTGSTEFIPVAPDNLVALMTAESKILLTWRDNSYNENGFVLEYKIGSGLFMEVDSIGKNIENFLFDPAGATDITFRIKSYNSVGESYSQEFLLEDILSCLSEQQTDEKVLVYPNPVHTFLTIEGNISGKLLIFNTKGLPVYKNTMEYKITIDASGWNTGYYTYVVLSGNSIVSGNIIKD